MAKTRLLRKPLGKREARSIQRLRSVAEMPVAKIALVTEGDKTTTHNVFPGNAKFAKAGAKAKLTNYFVPRHLRYKSAKTRAYPQVAFRNATVHRTRRGPL